MILIKCQRYRTSFSSYLNGDLNAQASRILEKHLQSCLDCQRELRTFRKTIELYKNLPLLSVPEELHTEIMKRIKEVMKLQPFNLHLIIRKTKVRVARRKEVRIMAERGRRGLMPWMDLPTLGSFRDEFDRLLDRFFPEFPSRWPETTWVPAVNVAEEEDRVVVKATIPGVDKNNLEVKVTGDTLILSGKTEEEREKREKDYYIHEIKSGAFRREVSLPSEVVADKVTASYRDGILTINLPKVKEARAKEVKVKIE